MALGFTSRGMRSGWTRLSCDHSSTQAAQRHYRAADQALADEHGDPDCWRDAPTAPPPGRELDDGEPTHLAHRADDATRDVVSWLKCEYMMDKIGEEFPGIISAVTSFGFFVELADIFVEGLVHISNLGQDYYHFDPTSHQLKGERTGTNFRLGDSVKIRVARVDLDEKKMDFELIQKDSAPKKAEVGDKPKKRRRKKK